MSIRRAIAQSKASNAFISIAPRWGKGAWYPERTGVLLIMVYPTGSNSTQHVFNKNAVAVKDNIAAALYPTTCGSKILELYRSPFEATAILSLRDGGDSSKDDKEIIMGKTNMDEFGMGSHSTYSIFGPVRGVKEGCSAGGSSGGSAVAVATGAVKYALGTDTGGSVRLPAAYNGIVGFKPSYGLISRWGVVPYANSLDTVGVLGVSTSSIFPHLVTELLQHGHDPQDPTSLSWRRRNQLRNLRKAAVKSATGQTKAEAVNMPLSKLKIGIPVEYNIEELEPVVREQWQTALELFQNQGSTLVPVSLPNTKHALSAYYVIAAAEAASNLSKYDGVRYGTRAAGSDGAGDSLYSKTRGQGFGEEVKRRILLGSYSLSSLAIDNYFIKAQRVRRLVQRDFDRVFSMPNPLRPNEQFDLSDMDESVHLENKLGPPQVDFIVCPTAPTLPPSHSAVAEQFPIDSYMNDVFTVPSSLAGLPAISIPFATSDGSRVGIQIIGQYYDDYRLLETARAVEQLRGKLHNLSLDTSSSTQSALHDYAPKIRKFYAKVLNNGDSSALPALNDDTPKIGKQAFKGLENTASRDTWKTEKPLRKRIRKMETLFSRKAYSKPNGTKPFL